jgi:hypothetical protein
MRLGLSRHALLDADGDSLDASPRRIFVANFRNGARLYADCQNNLEQERLSWTIDGELVQKSALFCSADS